MMERVQGKQRTAISADEVKALCRDYERVLIDFGTGDGNYVLRRARQCPDMLCIGIDAVAEAMTEVSRRALAKPARGGVDNALFLVSSLENLPTDLIGIASEVTVNFPWGSLLRALVEPDPGRLRKLARIGQAGAAFTILLNYSVFKDDDYLQRLDLPALDPARFEQDLAPAWRRAGFDIAQADFAPKHELDRTTWGKRLIRGADRETVLVTGHIGTNAVLPERAGSE